MNVDIIFSAREIFTDKVENKTVVVIDVLRATTVMITALKNGAKNVIPVLTPEEAFKKKEELGANNVVLGGERKALPIEGFDYGNSPISYTPEVIKNKTLIITTTNGTRAIVNSQSANKLYVGAFINDMAVVNLLENETDIVLVASGSHDFFTLEDSLCAGKIAFELQNKFNAKLTDGAIAMASLYKNYENNIHDINSKGKHYKRLTDIGANEDLTYCLTSNLTDVVPVLNKNGVLEIKK